MNEVKAKGVVKSAKKVELPTGFYYRLEVETAGEGWRFPAVCPIGVDYSHTAGKVITLEGSVRRRFTRQGGTAVSRVGVVARSVRIAR